MEGGEHGEFELQGVVVGGEVEGDIVVRGVFGDFDVEDLPTRVSFVSDWGKGKDIRCRS